MKTALLSIAAALAAITCAAPAAQAAAMHRSDSYVMAQATGGASSNTTTGSTATGNTDSTKGTTTPDPNKDSKTPAQK